MREVFGTLNALTIKLLIPYPMIKNKITGSFVSSDVSRRTRRSTFLHQIDTLIDWACLEKELYKVCKRSIQDAAGRPAYAPLILFKMMLLQTWYNLSDMGVEDIVNDTLSANAFCGLRVEDTVPDHSTLSRFRSELSEKRALHRLLNKLNAQLEHRGVLVQQGSGIIDASITPTLRKPKGKPTYILPETPETPLSKAIGPGVDQQARWVKRGDKLHYGYKRHYLAEAASGMVLAVHTTPANAHESQYLASCLDQASLPKGTRILADKGYCSQGNEALLRSRGLRSGIQRKACRHKPLTLWEKRYNACIGRSRYKIERVFGSIKGWFGRLEARYVGIVKTHAQHVLEAIAYNLYRLPGIVMSKS
jgi:transposase, IS5 family